MASRTMTQIHKLMLDALADSGDVEVSAFEASLPAEDARAAKGQIQALKLSGKVKTWRAPNAQGETVTFIGLK